MLRRDFLKLASLFSLGGSLPLLQACEKRQIASPDAPLKIGYLPITDATSLLVAHSQGFFAQQGLVVDQPIMFRSWSQLVEAFFSGSVNVVHILSPMSLWAKYAAQAPVKIVLWNHLAGSALTVRPDIQHVHQLAGRKIAIPFWYSIHNIVLQQWLRANGLRMTEKAPRANEVQLLVMAPADMLTALSSGAIAGFIVAEPFNALAEQKGIGRVLRFSADMWRDHACCVTLMNESDIQQRPQWVQKVVNGLVEAQHYILHHRSAIPKLIDRESGYTPHSQAVLTNVLSPTHERWQYYVDTGVIRHPDWRQNRIDFQPYPFESYLVTLVEMLQQTQLVGQNRFLDTLVATDAAKALNMPDFARQAILNRGWQQDFGLNGSWQRREQLDFA